MFRTIPIAGRSWPAWLLISILAWPGAAGAQQGADQVGPPRLALGSFFVSPVGPRGLELAEPLRQAAGRSVRLVGYMVAQEQSTPGEFLLTPRPLRLSEHADGDANDLPPATVTVLLDDSQHALVVPHRAGLLELVGRLDVGRREDAQGRVSWVRLRLPPDAVAVAPTIDNPSPTRIR